MTPSTFQNAPPTDFVAFLAERTGLTEEAAESRLLSWFGEFQPADRANNAPASSRRGRR